LKMPPAIAHPGKKTTTSKPLELSLT
jgi:hypothetical protein